MFIFPSIVYTIILMINYNAANEFQMALFRHCLEVESFSTSKFKTFNF